MSCPLYSDFTRDCIDQFDHMISYTAFDLCESEDYEQCLVYIALNSKINCKFLNDCLSLYDRKFPDFLHKMFDNKYVHDFIYDMMNKYCLTDNCENCAKYKKYNNGEMPPVNLRPDGKKLHLTDIILKRKIV